MTSSPGVTAASICEVDLLPCSSSTATPMRLAVFLPLSSTTMFFFSAFMDISTLDCCAADSAVALTAKRQARPICMVFFANCDIHHAPEFSPWTSSGGRVKNCRNHFLLTGRCLRRNSRDFLSLVLWFVVCFFFFCCWG